MISSLFYVNADGSWFLKTWTPQIHGESQEDSSKLFTEYEKFCPFQTFIQRQSWLVHQTLPEPDIIAKLKSSSAKIHYEATAAELQTVKETIADHNIKL